MCFGRRKLSAAERFSSGRRAGPARSVRKNRRQIMTRFFTLSAVGLLGAGLMLATPQESQAQSAIGVNVDLGRTGFSFYTGPQYVAPYYVVPPVAPVGGYVNPVAPYSRDPSWAWLH